jgi:hypothetical protein
MDQQTYAQQFLGLTWDQITSQLQGRNRQQALALWKWAAIHYSETLCPDQLHYWRRYGSAATFQRIDRVRAWLGLDAV